MTIYNIKFVLEVDKIDDMSTHEYAYSRHLSPGYKQKEVVSYLLYPVIFSIETRLQSFAYV